MVNKNEPASKDGKEKDNTGQTESATELQALEQSLQQYEGVIDRFDLGSNAEVMRLLQRLHEQQGKGQQEEGEKSKNRKGEKARE